MSQKPAQPLIAKLQTAPDAAWGPLLAGIDEAVRRYDPETQTGDLLARADAAAACRATGSGGATALSAEDGTKGVSYRAVGSGGATALSAEDSNKSPSQGGEQDEPTYRALASGGSARFPDDGSKSATYRALASGGSTRFPDDGTKG